MHAWVPPVKGKQKLSTHSNRSKVKSVPQTLRSPSRPLIERARSEMKRRTKIMDLVCQTFYIILRLSNVNNNYSKIRGDGMEYDVFNFCHFNIWLDSNFCILLFLFLCPFGNDAGCKDTIVFRVQGKIVIWRLGLNHLGVITIILIYRWLMKIILKESSNTHHRCSPDPYPNPSFLFNKICPNPSTFAMSRTLLVPILIITQIIFDSRFHRFLAIIYWRTDA